MDYKVTPRLGEILKDRKMTQNDLAELTGISQAVISRFDKNRQHVDLQVVLIAKALGVNMEDLFHIEEIK